MVLNRHFQQQAQPVFHPEARPEITAHNFAVFETDAFRDELAARLAGSVRIPTVTYDGMDHVGTDPRWDVFYEHSEYLKKAFPRIYKTLELQTVNEHGLLYTWPGSESHLRPLLFMAHSDVVPAGTSTTAEWTHPPFEGHYDGEYIWGRGSEDDKSNIVAMLTAIDCLLECNFIPSRTVIISVGFDEEGGAEQSYGARCLAELLLEKYGKNGLEMIFDEGIAGIENRFGTDFALPATAEKGYVDVTVSIHAPGGHSSTPPDHTGIGYIAQVIRIIEDHPFTSKITRPNPTLTYLRQAARLSKSMPEELRKAILGPHSSERILEYMDSSRERRAMVRTSTAVDVISGGDKVNSLPESVNVVVNHRIAIQDSVQAVKDHYIRLLEPWAVQQRFRLIAFGAVLPSGRSESTSKDHLEEGTLILETQYELDSSPVSDAEDDRFGWLVGTLRGVFGDDVVVAPELLTGNTDTRYYWDLSTQIYRMSPWRASHDPRGTRMHTVDERMPVKGLVEMVRFYHEFIRVLDEKRM